MNSQNNNYIGDLRREMPTQGQVNDFKKEIPGAVDEKDATTYKFPRIISKRHDGKESFYDIVVRVAKGIPASAKGAKELEKHKEEFIDIDDKYFDSKVDLPAGAYGWYKVNYYAIAESDPGKGQKPTRVYSGKNIGKKNQTNPFTQALRDALSRYNKQIQKSQEEVTSDVTVKADLLPPMLANAESDNIAKINFEAEAAAGRKVYIQPKLNGTRGVAALNIGKLGDIAESTILYTRKRKIITGLKYIQDEAFSMLLQFYKENNFRLRLDGEFYVHGTPLELISGAMRREKEGESSDLKLQYHVFDVFSEDKSDANFTTRMGWMNSVFANATQLQYIKLVLANEVKNKDDIKSAYEAYLKEGYEGAIIRLDYPYKYSYNDRRAKWLLKMKPVMDAEFEIVGYEAAEKGKASGWLILHLKTKGGKVFNLSNFGERGDELRQELYEKMSKPDTTAAPLPDGTQPTIFDTQYKGKYITVLFDEWSRFGVPLRARTEGIVIRDYE